MPDHPEQGSPDPQPSDRQRAHPASPIDDPPPTASQQRALMQLSSAGFELATFSLLLGGAGYGIDHWLGTAKPYFAIAGVLLGFCLGFYRLIVLASKMN